ncbi:MAG: C69 family dipeptidase [Clostridia bacterium]|nr:C69 family dipeptidase [Clostridia bacterium]
MQSCDTLVINKSRSVYGQNILAKNSDRPTGEPQPLCFYEAKEYPEGAILRTTYLDIPQVRKTYTVVGSRPYWIWGFEMGYNEKGLMIGNEAEWSRMESETEEGLLGMDLLRLGLERAATAREAIEVITTLLKQYGQKAGASKLKTRYYENSFILADKDECWILETAGREWVAREVKDTQGVSNCYSIGKNFDKASENLEAIAREKRWLAPDEAFDFAKAYTGHVSNLSGGTQRYRRSNKLLAKKELHDFSTLAAILRDHHDDELISPRFGATNATFASLCMHAGEWGASETSASLLARYDEDLGIIARYAPAQACLSAYIPVYMNDLPEKMQTADRKFDKNSLWWQLKRLALLVSVDEERFGEEVRLSLASLGGVMEQLACTSEHLAKRFIEFGDYEDAMDTLKTATESCTRLLYELAERESDRIAEIIVEDGGLYGRQKETIEKYIEYSGIELL